MVGCRRGHASIKVVGIYKEVLRDFLSVPIILRLTSNSTPPLSLPPLSHSAFVKRRREATNNGRTPLIFHGSQVRSLSILSHVQYPRN